MAPLNTLGKLTAACLLFAPLALHAQEKSAAPQVEVDQNTARFLENAKSKTQTQAQPQNQAPPQIQPDAPADAPKAANTVQDTPVNGADAAGAQAAGEGAAAVDAADVSPNNAKNKGKVKKVKKKKEKAPKLTPVQIVNGTLTVDGATGKASLNYDIPDLKFIYIYSPGLGTAIISNKAFPGAVEQKAAFSQNTVDVMVEDHKLEIYSDKPLFDPKKDKDIARDLKKQPISAWVAIDKDFTLPTNYPAMGFGLTTAAPYAWPGSKPVPKRDRGVVAPPPMPVALRPVLASPKSATPAGVPAAAVSAGTAPQGDPKPAGVTP